MIVSSACAVGWCERCQRPHTDMELRLAAPAIRRRKKVRTARKVLLHFHQSPGDTLVAAGALECLHRQFPGDFLTGVVGVATEVFENNPHVSILAEEPDVVVKMDNPLIHECDKRPVHFLESYCAHLGRGLGVQLPCTVNRPYLYLSEQEKSWISQVQEITGQPTRFWLVTPSVKKDYTVKGWGHDNYQRVIDILRGRVQFVQVGAAEHEPRRLNGVIDLVGKTDHRQLYRLAWHADGGLGAESYLMHIFAALAKPFVALLSGFLPPSWVQYPTVTQLHRHGRLPCCREKACWKARTVPLGDGDEKDKSLCELPVLGGEPVPKCLAMLAPEEVAAAIESYYVGGVLRHGL